MCVALHPSEFSDTTLYVGEARHTDYGLVHVVGYQNHVKNTSRRSNCMVLHFPSAEPMDNRSALDCSGSPEILNDMRVTMDAIHVGTDFGEVQLKARPDAIHVFDVGSYSVVMSATPSLVPSALDLTGC